MDRREFIKKSALTDLVLSSGAFPMLASPTDANITKITILHTNDVHSRIEPFPMDGGRNQGMGGVAQRAVLIDKIRKREKNVLLFDAGDIFQGTPYFNFFGGEIEMKLMSKLGYDAGTIGNHDFDAGIEGLARQLKHANFPLVISNYDLSDTVLNGRTLDYKIFKKDGIKIGVFGLGIEMYGLILESLYKGARYLDPVSIAQNRADFLRNEMKCDYVICLSHLGYKYGEADGGKISDVRLAKMTDNIDLIIGGHTHTFLNQPDRVVNKEGKPVIISQVGWAGIVLGRLDIHFERNKKGTCVTCKNLLVNANI